MSQLRIVFYAFLASFFWSVKCNSDCYNKNFFNYSNFLEKDDLLKPLFYSPLAYSFENNRRNVSNALGNIQSFFNNPFLYYPNIFSTRPSNYLANEIIPPSFLFDNKEVKKEIINKESMKKLEIEKLQSKVVAYEKQFEKYARDRKLIMDELSKTYANNASLISDTPDDYSEIESLIKSKKGSSRLNKYLYNYAQNLENEKITLKNKIDRLVKQIEKDNSIMLKITQMKTKIEEKIDALKDGNFPIGNQPFESKGIKKEIHNYRSDNEKFLSDEELNELFEQ